MKQNLLVVLLLLGSNLIIKGQWNGTNPLWTNSNVGIGTSSLNYLQSNRTTVDINGTSSALLGFSVSGTSKGYLYHEGTNMFLTNDVNGHLYFQTNGILRARILNSGAYELTQAGENVYLGSTLGTAPYLKAIWDDNSWTGIEFFTGVNGVSTSTMLIKNGRVGIGTTSPLNIFFVSNKFLVNNDGVIKWGSSADYGLLSWDTGITLVGGQSGKNLALISDGYEKVRILTNGKVGIGTSNPQNLLDVNGTVHAKEFKASLDGWSDYVFNENYKLRSLDEVEHYIHLNRRLPEIPSEIDVINNGVDLGAMNSLLLKKIEELTIYMINQNKKIEVLEQDIIKLKHN